MSDKPYYKRTQEKGRIIMAETKIITFDRAKKVEELKDLRTSAEELCKLYNEANQNGEKEKAAGFAESIDEKVGEYGNLARRIAYEDFHATQNPMVAAVTAFQYVAIVTKDEKVGDDPKTQITVRSIEDRAKFIDLLHFHKWRKVGYNQTWNFTAEKLCQCLVLRASGRIGGKLTVNEVKKKIEISQIAESVSLGRAPTSNTNLLKVLQRVVTEMLGEGYKVTSHDVNFMIENFSGSDKNPINLGVRNTKKFVELLLAICHHIVTGNPYGVTGYQGYKK